MKGQPDLRNRELEPVLLFGGGPLPLGSVGQSLAETLLEAWDRWSERGEVEAEREEYVPEPGFVPLIVTRKVRARLVLAAPIPPLPYEEDSSY